MDGEDSPAVKESNIVFDALVNKFCLGQDKPKQKDDFNLWALLLQFANHKNCWIVLVMSILFYAVLWVWNAQLRSIHHGNVELTKAIFRYFTPVTEVHSLVDSLTPYAVWSFYAGQMCVVIEFLLPSLISWGWFFNSIPVVVFGVGYLAKDYLTDTVRQHFTTAAAFPFSVNNIILLDGRDPEMRVVETNCKGFVRFKEVVNEGSIREHFIPIDKVLKSKITVIGNGGGGQGAQAHNSDACLKAVTAAFTSHAMYVFLMGDGTAGNPGISKRAWDFKSYWLSNPKVIMYLDVADRWLPLGWLLFVLHAVPFLRPPILASTSSFGENYCMFLMCALLFALSYWVLSDFRILPACLTWCKSLTDEDWDKIGENVTARLYQPIEEDAPFFIFCFMVEIFVLSYSCLWGVDQHIVPFICIAATFKVVMNIEKEQKVNSDRLEPSHAAIESAIVAAAAVFMTKGILAV